MAEWAKWISFLVAFLSGNAPELGRTSYLQRYTTYALLWLRTCVCVSVSVARIRTTPNTYLSLCLCLSLYVYWLLSWQTHGIVISFSGYTTITSPLLWLPWRALVCVCVWWSGTLSLSHPTFHLSLSLCISLATYPVYLAAIIIHGYCTSDHEYDTTDLPSIYLFVSTSLSQLLSHTYIHTYNTIINNFTYNNT